MFLCLWALISVEQAVEFCVYFVDYHTEVFGVVGKIEFVDVHDKEFSFVVFRDPVVIALVEAGEIVQTNGILVFSAATLYLADERGDVTFEVDEKVGWLNKRGEKFEHLDVVLEVACVEESHGMEVGRKDIGIFIQGAVLDDVGVGFPDVDELFEAGVEKINLKIEGPAAHVFVKTVDVRVVVGWLKYWPITVVSCQQFCQGCLSRSDVSSYGDMHYEYIFNTLCNAIC